MYLLTRPPKQRWAFKRMSYAYIRQKFLKVRGAFSISLFGRLKLYGLATNKMREVLSVEAVS